MSIKAISLLSGGLDSTIATGIIKNMGIKVIALNFTSPFCLCGGKKKANCKHIAVEMAEKLGVEIKVKDITDKFIEIVKKPKYGYGRSMNPCIDCRILKLKEAKKFMEEINASFIITGEVLGQRPMSQNRNALEIIEKESNLEGLIVRPLCAKYMPETIPEKLGIIDRKKLLDIKGRSRKKQLNIIKEFNIDNFACPAGGCLLTDENFGKKVKDFINANMFNRENINFLKYGRYFAITDTFKLIIGRNETENIIIKNMKRKNDILFYSDGKGPVGLGRGKACDKDITLAAYMVAYYYKEKELEIKCVQDDTEINVFIKKDEGFFEKIKKY